jgi:hypothetical protein
MMFEPGKLDSFDLLFENEVYRVFAVGSPPVQRKRPASPLFYRRGLLNRTGGDRGDFYSTVMHMYAVTVRASRMAAGGDTGGAEEILYGVLETDYFHPAWKLLDSLLRRRGASRERLALAEFAGARDPWRARVCIAIAESRMGVGDVEGAAEAIARCEELPMTGAEKRRLGRISIISGD